MAWGQVGSFRYFNTVVLWDNPEMQKLKKIYLLSKMTNLGKNTENKNIPKSVIMISTKLVGMKIDDWGRFGVSFVAFG